MEDELFYEFMKKSLIKEYYKQEDDYEYDLKLLTKLKAGRFGEVSLFKNEENVMILAVKEKKINNKDELDKEIILAKELIGQKHRYLINLNDYTIKTYSDSGSTFYIFKRYYEFPMINLRVEIEFKKQEGGMFSASELFLILQEQVSVGFFLQSKGLYHGNIHPFIIAFDEDRGSRLIEPDGHFRPKRNIRITQIQRILEDKNLYQSPVTFNNLSKQYHIYYVNQNKEDVYALGLVILELGLIHSIQDIYDKELQEFRLDVLDKHINSFKAKYEQEDKLLTETVVKMLTLYEGHRPCFEALFYMLPEIDDGFEEYLRKIQKKSTDETTLKDNESNRIIQESQNDFSGINFKNDNRIQPSLVQSQQEFTVNNQNREPLDQKQNGYSRVSRQDATVIVKQLEPTVVYRDSRVKNQGVTEIVNIGELRLVRTYQDYSRATRMN